MGLIVVNHVTLDGVMQGPGRPDEDTRDGFAHGGWAMRGNEGAAGQEIQRAVGRRMGEHWGLLLGRRSYEGMLSSWNRQGGPFKDALNDAPKYVASSDPTAALEWPNSTLLTGDIPSAVADLKQRSPGNLIIMGSGQLIRSIRTHGLIDEYLLMIHPLVLGTGRRLFERDDHVTRLRLSESTPTSSGVIIASYVPA